MRALRLIAAALLLLGLAGAPARAQTLARPEGPVDLKADSITYDQELGLVVASGNVEIVQAGRTLLADSVTYNERTDTVTAAGNVNLIEPTGEIMFADYVELTGDLKEGAIQNLRVLLTDQSRFAAAGGRRIGGNRTELDKAVYSPCQLCKEHPDRPPLWQIKAARVIHDQESKDIIYNDAFLEFYGIPVAYTPYFSHPDPTVKRRSGFLAPSGGSDTNLGIWGQLPYYWTFSPSMDATFAPIFTAREGPVLFGEFRQRLSYGEYKLEASFTRPDARDSRGAPKSGKENRGHIRGDGIFNIDKNWRAGFKIDRSSDETYLRRYNFVSDEVLTSRGYAEGFYGRSYVSMEALAFQDTRIGIDDATVPFVAPQLDLNFLSEAGSFGQRFSADLNVLNLFRREGTDSRRFSLKTGMTIPYTSPFGDMYSLSLTVQGDVYIVNNVTEIAGAPADTDTNVVTRLFPQAVFEWRYPWVRQDESFQTVIEPIVQFIASPNSPNPNDIPNEDSQDITFDDSNVFSPNRFSGLDRLDGGNRVIYGVRAGIYGNDGGSGSVFIGQSYALREDATFPEGSGLGDNYSDIVGRVHLQPASWLDLLYRFQLSQEDLPTPRRNELSMRAGPDIFRIGVEYFFFDQQETEDEFGDRQEINLTISSQITDYWSVNANARRDLEGGAFRNYGAGIQYEDECFLFTLGYERQFFRDRDIKPSDSVFVRVVFKQLGGFSSADTGG